MGENVPVGGIKFRVIYVISILSDRPKCITKFLHVAWNSVETAYDLLDEFCVYLTPPQLCYTYYTFWYNAGSIIQFTTMFNNKNHASAHIFYIMHI